MVGVDPDHLSGVGAFSGKQAGAAQIGPQGAGDLRLHQGGVLLHFGGGARAGYHGGHGRVGRAELQRGRLDVGAVALAEGADGVGARHHVGFRRLVVEGRAAGQQAGIVGPAQHDLDALGGQAGNSASSAV